MIDELELLSRQRPVVPPPSDTARASALTQLNDAITGKGGARRRPARFRLGWLAPAAALAATLLVAGGAIVLLHRAPSRAESTHPATDLGLVVGRGGTVLARTRVSPMHRYVRVYPRGRLDVVTGAESEYGSALRAGDSLRLSLYPPLQQAGQVALYNALASNRGASGGTFVALNPDNGRVLAMGSTGGVSRAISDAGPVGSVFTPITALAALQSGAWSPVQTFDDTGEYCFSTSVCVHNAGHATYGVVDLVSALRVVDNIFFDNLGGLMNRSQAVQNWALQLGAGQETGIDLPGEAGGSVPSHRSTVVNASLAGGQFPLRMTSLQVAVAYAALANGGNIVTPHVGLEIRSPRGSLLRQIDPAPRHHLDINPAYRELILEGMRQAASSPGGTSADVFSRFPEQVYGEAGTAQQLANGVAHDTAWYAGFVSATATSKPIVVVVTIDGGFGAVAAAPVAREILSQWFFGKPGPYIAGTSGTL